MKVMVRESYYDRDGFLGGKYGLPKHYLFRKGDVEEIKGEIESSCCLDMKMALDEYYVGFGEYDDLLNEVPGVCIYHCNPYPEGASWDEMIINFCPFCGEEIILEEEK